MGTGGGGRAGAGSGGLLGRRQGFVRVLADGGVVVAGLGVPRRPLRPRQPLPHDHQGLADLKQPCPLEDWHWGGPVANGDVFVGGLRGLPTPGGPDGGAQPVLEAGNDAGRRLRPLPAPLPPIPDPDPVFAHPFGRAGVMAYPSPERIRAYKWSSSSPSSAASAAAAPCPAAFSLMRA